MLGAVCRNRLEQDKEVSKRPRHIALVGAALIGMAIEKDWIESDETSFDLPRILRLLGQGWGIEVSKREAITYTLGMFKMINKKYAGVEVSEEDQEVAIQMFGDLYDELVEKFGVVVRS